MIMSQIDNILLWIEVHEYTPSNLSYLLFGHIESRECILHDLLYYFVLTFYFLKPISNQNRSTECPRETLDFVLTVYDVLHSAIVQYFECKSRSRWCLHYFHVIVFLSASEHHQMRHLIHFTSFNVIW